MEKLQGSCAGPWPGGKFPGESFGIRGRARGSVVDCRRRRAARVFAEVLRFEGSRRAAPTAEAFSHSLRQASCSGEMSLRGIARRSTLGLVLRARERRSPEEGASGRRRIGSFTRARSDSIWRHGRPRRRGSGTRNGAPEAFLDAVDAGYRSCIEGRRAQRRRCPLRVAGFLREGAEAFGVRTHVRTRVWKARESTDLRALACVMAVAGIDGLSILLRGLDIAI